MVNAAEVKIWDTLAGAVRWDESRQLATFEYAPSFLSKGWDLSPIHMPLANGARVYSFPDLLPAKDGTENTFKGLPGLLADTLPDRYGTDLINIWLARQGRAVNSMNPVEMLCFMGKRGMGALEFEPAHFKLSATPFNIELSSLVEVAHKMLSRKQNFGVNLKKDEQKAMGEILKIGTSAGGARPKAVIAYNKATGEVRSGQTIAPNGFEHWLLKLDGVSDAQFGASHGYGRVEYAYYLMAKDCGIDIMDCELLEEKGRAHFMTKRFDREGHNTRHHIQTFCGIQHYDYTNLFGYGYEQLFQTMRKLRLTYPEAEQMFKRMVFNVLAVNYDDHTKNFAFRLKQNGRWELAPAYDICFSYNPNNAWVSQQTLSINGKHKNITKADLMSIAEANNIKKGEAIIDKVNMVVSNWRDYATKVKVSEALTNTILNVIESVKF